MSCGGNGDGSGDGATEEMVRTVKSIVSGASKSEICEALLNSKMDPNDAALRLLSRLDRSLEDQPCSPLSVVPITVDFLESNVETLNGYDPGSPSGLAESSMSEVARSGPSAPFQQRPQNQSGLYDQSYAGGSLHRSMSDMDPLQGGASSSRSPMMSNAKVFRPSESSPDIHGSFQRSLLSIAPAPIQDGGSIWSFNAGSRAMPPVLTQNQQHPGYWQNQQVVQRPGYPDYYGSQTGNPHGIGQSSQQRHTAPPDSGHSGSLSRGSMPSPANDELWGSGRCIATASSSKVQRSINYNILHKAHKPYRPPHFYKVASLLEHKAPDSKEMQPEKCYGPNDQLRETGDSEEVSSCNDHEQYISSEVSEKSTNDHAASFDAGSRAMLLVPTQNQQHPGYWQNEQVLQRPGYPDYYGSQTGNPHGIGQSSQQQHTAPPGYMGFYQLEDEIWVAQEYQQRPVLRLRGGASSPVKKRVYKWRFRFLEPAKWFQPGAFRLGRCVSFRMARARVKRRTQVVVQPEVQLGGVKRKRSFVLEDPHESAKRKFQGDSSFSVRRPREARSASIPKCLPSAHVTFNERTDDKQPFVVTGHVFEVPVYKKFNCYELAFKYNIHTRTLTFHGLWPGLVTLLRNAETGEETWKLKSIEFKPRESSRDKTDKEALYNNTSTKYLLYNFSDEANNLKQRMAIWRGSGRGQRSYGFRFWMGEYYKHGVFSGMSCQTYFEEGLRLAEENLPTLKELINKEWGGDQKIEKINTDQVATTFSHKLRCRPLLSTTKGEIKGRFTTEVPQLSDIILLCDLGLNLIDHPMLSKDEECYI